MLNANFCNRSSQSEQDIANCNIITHTQTSDEGKIGVLEPRKANRRKPSTTRIRGKDRGSAKLT